MGTFNNDQILKDWLLAEAEKCRLADEIWPGQFLAAIPVGVNLEKVKVPFLIFVLKTALTSFNHTRYPAVKKSIDDVIDLYESGETDLEKYKQARKAAVSAITHADIFAVVAHTNVFKAAHAAAHAAAAFADTRAVARAASFTADATAAYATDAARADTRSPAFAAAYAAAGKKTYIEFADKLIELLKGAN